MLITIGKLIKPSNFPFEEYKTSVEEIADITFDTDNGEFNCSLEPKNPKFRAGNDFSSIAAYVAYYVRNGWILKLCGKFGELFNFGKQLEIFNIFI